MKVLLMVAMWALAAQSFAQTWEPPAHRTRASCMEVVRIAGARIAQMRWYEGVDGQKLLAAPFRPGLPQWYMDTVQRWIAQAWAFQGTPKQWLQGLVNECLMVEANLEEVIS